jgi:hypothetical protein
MMSMANLTLWIEFYYDLLVADDMPSRPEQKEARLSRLSTQIANP